MWTHVQCMACVLMYQHLLFGQRICCGLFLWTQVLGTWTESERRKQKLDWLATFQPKEKCNPCHFVWVKSKLQHPPHPLWATPHAFDFFENYRSNSPLPEPKCRSNAPRHTRVHSGDQMPPPQGHFTGIWTTEGRQKRLQFSNKIFINTANNSHSI